MRLNASAFKKFTQSPFYKAYEMFPGNYLLDRWQESKKVVWDTLVAMEEKEGADLDQISKWKEELKSKKDMESWVRYLSKKYIDIVMENNND